MKKNYSTELTISSSPKRKFIAATPFRLLMVFVLCMSVGKGWAQTPVPMSSQPGLSYTENFADITNWGNDFVSGIGANRWKSYPITAGGTANDGKRTTKSSATFVTGTSGGVQKGTGNFVFLSTGSTATSEAVAVDLLLDYTGVNAGTLSFNWAGVDNGGGTRPTSLRIFWSTDNTTFTEITAAQVIDVQSPTTGSITTVALPSAFNNSATARLRFYNHAGTVTGGGNRDKISIDDVTVTATALVNPSIAISDGAIAAGNVNQGTNNVVLQRYDLAVTAANATLNGLTVTTAGSYIAADITNLKVRYSTDATLDGGDATLSTKTTGLGAGSQVFPSFTPQSITSGTTGYVFVTADIASGATASNTINIGSTAFSNISFSGTVTKTGTDPVAAGGAQTFVVAIPDIAISNASPAAGNINQNSVNNILYSLQLDVTTTSATINSLTVTTAGTYIAGDIQSNGFKLWFNSTNNLSGATQIGTSAVVTSGNNIVFSGLTQVIGSGATGFLLVTANVAYNATASNTISITSTPFSNIVFASGNKTGTDPAGAGNAQTITAVSPSVAIAGAAIAAGTIGQNTVSNILYQASFAVTANSTNLTGITVTTAGTYVTGDIQTNGFKLWYNTSNTFGTATNIASIAAVSSGGNLIFSGLSQLIPISTSGFIWVTADIATGATIGNTINITSTPFSNIVFDNGAIKTGTDPIAAGGVKTIVQAPPVAGEILINQVSPAYSTATDEYIELVNTTNKTFDLSLLKIGYQSAAGVTGGAGGALIGTLAPHSFWLLSPNATVTVGSTAALARDGSISSGMANGSGQIALLITADNTKIDGVGYGTITGGTYTETSAATSPANPGGITRITDGVDNNTNSTDFATVAPANIYLRNSNSRLANAGSTIAGGTYTDISVTGNSSIAGNVTVSNKLSLTSGAFSIGSNTLTLNGTVTGTGTLSGSSTSNLVIAGTAGTLNFTSGSRTLKDLTLNAGASATLGTPLDITAGASPNNSGTVIVNGGAVLASAGNLTIKSNEFGTARVGTSAGAISGNVTVERFIKLRAPGTGPGADNYGRAYRLLAPSVTTSGGSTIRTNWMENGLNTVWGTNDDPVHGYGTQISGAGGSSNGFDVTGSNAPSLYSTTNGITPTYTAIGSTGGNLNALTGYFLYLRGDRSMDMTLPLTTEMPTSSTTLRATGLLTQGPVSSFTNAYDGTALSLNLVTNPYASAIDFNQVYIASSNIAPFYTFWDPNFGTRGGFVTVTIGGVASSGAATQYIQSGQAFFVQADGVDVPVVNITETQKAANNNNGVFRGPPPPTESFNISLYYKESSGYRRVADGATAIYNAGYSEKVDVFDAVEINNWDENIAIARDGKHLAIESRPVIVKSDELPLFMNNMKQKTYEFEFTPSAFTNTRLTAELVDNFTGKHTPVSVTDVTVVSFSVTSDPASFATDRFKVVFGTIKAAETPVTTNDHPIIVYPNPIKGNNFSIELNNLAKGTYNISLVNNLGQPVYSAQLEHPGGNVKKTIKLNSMIGAGTYRLMVKGENVKLNQLIIKN